MTRCILKNDYKNPTNITYFMIKFVTSNAYIAAAFWLIVIDGRPSEICNSHVIGEIWASIIAPKCEQIPKITFTMIKNIYD